MKISSDKVPHPSRITVVIPTYQEVDNIPHLIERLGAIRRQHHWDLDVLFMDDDSCDGSAGLVESMGLPWVQLITRSGPRGLSAAVLDGLERARGDVLVVMDCDLSHPPEALPEMLEELESGAEFVVGSRFVEGGTTDDNWGIFRWLNSRVATLLALPLTSLKDPMSGFFMLRRTTFDSTRDYSPIGYKIGLELLVKCRCRYVAEVPIHFSDRRFGKSKLSVKEQLRYLRHIRRLYAHRFEFWSQLAHFLLVGASGLGVNLLVLTAALALGAPLRLAFIAAIALSMMWNFALNRLFSFSGSRTRSVSVQFFSFVLACSVGAGVNYLVALWVMHWTSLPQLAAVTGVVAATGFNFIASRLYVFKARHVVAAPQNDQEVLGTQTVSTLPSREQTASE